MIGEHTVTVYPDATLTGGADLSCLIDSVAIAHGRDDTGSQPEASSVTIDLTTDLDPLPATVEIGAYLKATTHTLATYTRFLGRITDIALGWEDFGPDTPDHGIGKITAVGVLADLGRKVVGDAPFPQELDGARVSRVLALAGVTLNPATSDPGTVQILPRDIDSQPALDVAQGTAFSSGGVLWETAGGDIRYADSNHRKGAQPALTLDACDLFVTPTWRRTLEGLVNEVSIGYGVAAEGGEQPRYVATNEPSKARYGRYGYTTTTELAAAADATAMGQLLLVRNGSPVWVMAALPVDTKGLDDARMEQLLGLDVHSLITLTGLPAIGSAPTSATLWVEGWRETLEFGSHAIELVVSGYCRTVPAPKWDEVNPSWVWGGRALTELRRNYMPNPSFEGAAALTGWSLSATATWSVDATTAAPGAGASSSKAVRTNGTVNNYNTPNIPAAAGEVWTFSFWYKTTSTAAGVAIVHFRNAADAIISQPTFPLPAVAAWTRVSGTFTAPAGTVGIRLNPLYCANGANGDTHWVDGVMAEKSPAVGAYFDGDTPDYSGADFAWTGAPGASESTLTGARELRRNIATNPSCQASPTVGWSSNDGAKCPAVDDPTVSHSRGQSRVSSPAGTNIGVANGPVASLYDVGGLPFPVTPGQTYTASLWLLANVATSGDCRIYWRDAAGANIGGANIGAAVPVPGDSATWVRAVCTFTAPANAATMRVMTTVVRTGGALTTAADKVWADDCLVTATNAANHGEYFDGTTLDTEALDYAWTGTPDASASVLTEILQTTGGLPPTLTWDDMTCLGPPINIGRWDDQPASLRWDQVSPAYTWDTYPPIGM